MPPPDRACIIKNTRLREDLDVGWKNTSARFGSLSIAMHWLMFALLVAVYACIELRTQFPKGSLIREGLKEWHFMLGLAVFALVWLRLFARLFGKIPAIVPEPSKLQMRIAHLFEFALYVFMIAMPLLGWMILNGEGKPAPFFGLELPPLIAVDKAFAKQLEEVHETVGTVGYFLIGTHALAALVHHYIKRDNALRRMLPAW
jgi:cytochrome b561